MIVAIGLMLGMLMTQQTPPPALEVPPQVHAGRLVPGSRTTLAIPLANRGPNPLDILDVATDCGCAQVVLPTRRLAPEQRITLKTILEAGPHAGPLEKKITLRTNDPHHPEQAVLLRALVKPLVVFQQAHVALHGFSRSDSVQSLEVAIESERPLKPELLRDKAPAWLSGFVILESPLKGTLCLDLEPSTLPLDRTSGQEILVLATGIPEQPEIRLELLWKVQDDLVVSGDPVILSPLAPVGSLSVRALDGYPIVLSPDSKPPALEVLGDSGIPVASPTLRLKWHGPWPSTAETHHLELATDRPNQPRLWIRVLLQP